MSTVFVHVGQAGCQLAQALWPTLACERPCSPDLFCPRAAPGQPPRPRAVLVDGEPKVIEAALAERRGGSRSTKVEAWDDFAFDPSAAAWSQSGRGGNFALGYAGDGGAGVAAGGRPELVGQALECMRRQSEACHGAHIGTVLTHSLGGGTGSGLGSRLAVELRDEYPRVPLFTLSVLPITAGENPVQCFNALLALATLQEVADGVLLYENDRLMALASDGKGRGGPSRAPPASGGARAAEALGSDAGASLMAMNEVITSDLSALLCPPLTGTPLDIGEEPTCVWCWPPPARCRRTASCRPSAAKPRRHMGPLRRSSLLSRRSRGLRAEAPPQRCAALGHVRAAAASCLRTQCSGAPRCSTSHPFAVICWIAWAALWLGSRTASTSGTALRRCALRRNRCM
mmetsp:Transcript_88755/g.286814  ORF Transcript_88755/g.286814 Transcript_88755/m.286814 type:complete len:401 (-) Transcript_88755:396-1598(-)